MNRHPRLVVAGCMLLALAGATQVQAREAAGGVRAWRGPQGAGAATARRYRSDGEGNAQGGHIHAYERPNGNTGYRGAQFETHADGSASRHAEAERNTQHGTLTRSSDASRDAEGNTSYQRDTSFSGTNGNTIEAQVTRDNGTVSRTVTCDGGECSKPAAPR